MRQAEEGMVHQGPKWYSLLLGPGEAGPSINFVLGPMNLSAGTVGVVLGLGRYIISNKIKYKYLMEKTSCPCGAGAKLYHNLHTLLLFKWIAVILNEEF